MDRGDSVPEWQVVDELSRLQARIRPRINRFGLLAVFGGALAVFGLLMLPGETLYRFVIGPTLLIAGVAALSVALIRIGALKAELRKQAHRRGYLVRQSQYGGTEIMQAMPQDHSGHVDVILAVQDGRFCRACCTAIATDDGRMYCWQCHQVFHTQCLLEGHICPYCSHEEEIPEEIEEYCVDQEFPTGRALEHNADLSAVELRPRSVEPPTYLARLRRNLPQVAEDYGDDDESIRRLYRAEAHGWPNEVSKAWRSTATCLPRLLFLAAAIYLPFHPEKTGHVVTLMIFLLLSQRGYLFFAGLGDRIRARRWPLAAPSPPKSVLIGIRTWLVGFAAVSYYVMLGVFAFFDPASTTSAVLMLILIPVFSFSAIGAVLIGLVCLAVR